MNAVVSASVFDRPLRPDLAAYFAHSRRTAPACAAKPQAPLVGVLAELARRGHG